MSKNVQWMAKKDFLSGQTKQTIATKYGVSYKTVQRWAKDGLWDEEYLAASAAVSGAAICLAEGRDPKIKERLESMANRQAEELFDVAEIVSRQVRVGRSLQAKAIQALKLVRPDELTPKDLLAWLQVGVQIENLAIGRATERVEVYGKIDFAKLSDEQLAKLAAGEDVTKVIAA